MIFYNAKGKVMMNFWEEILKDNSIIDRYNNINKETNYVIDHGLLHVKNVLNYIDKICDFLLVDKQKRNLAHYFIFLHSQYYWFVSYVILYLFFCFTFLFNNKKKTNS